jgi:hypothetical protein
MVGEKAKEDHMVAFLTTWSLSDGIVQCWRNWFDLSKLNNGFEEFSQSDADLRKEDHGHTQLLFHRMARLDLDSNEVAQIEPQMFRDLRIRCTLCDSHEQCDHDLTCNLDDQVWQDYCPNFPTLKTLNALPWAARREW